MARALIVVSMTGFLACGKVEVSPDATTCPGDQIECDPDGCVDTLTDERHCGDCTTSCTNQQGCLAGDCVDATESCARIKALDPGATDGPYTHAGTGRPFYCDMARGIQYDQLALGQYNGTYPGYQLAGLTELSDPVIQKAFTFLFNTQGGGMITLTPEWTDVNCCIATTTAGGVFLKFGPNHVFPAKLGLEQLACNQSLTDAKYSFQRAGVEYAPVPLPADYFTTNPVSTDTTCSTAGNPAFFFKRTP
ncbi:MAG TPA: hypothetical protein VIU61_11480 [Kofleriaceae bacterium]